MIHLPEITILNLQRISFLAAFCALTLCSCGGGTTGTSGTSELRILGKAERQDGSAISDQPMEVLEETTERPLLSSATDSSGNFEMVLPRPELGVIVELLGTRTQPLVSSLEGAVAVSTTLTQKTSGGISFGSTVAASLRFPPNCSALELQGNQLVVVSEDLSDSCDLIVELESTALDSPMVVSLVATCDGQVKVFDEDGVNSGRGQGTVSLSLLDTKVCKDARIEVSEISNSLKPILFSILTP